MESRWFWVATASLVVLLAVSTRSAEARGHGAFSGDCQACHAPQSLSGSQPSPRWQNAAYAFTVYRPASPGGSPRIGQPGPASLACLSCHDGTVAGSRAGNGTRHESLGIDLSDDHPIGFVYDSARAASDRGLHDPEAQPSGLGGTIAQDMLVDGRVECTSCHGQHHGGDAGPMLLKSNSGSALCLTCHAK